MAEIQRPVPLFTETCNYIKPGVQTWGIELLVIKQVVKVSYIPVDDGFRFITTYRITMDMY